jgi:hypothetical protein
MNYIWSCLLSQGETEAMKNGSLRKKLGEQGYSSKTIDKIIDFYTG